MEGPVVFPLAFEDSKAYAQVNALANHAQKTFANVKGDPFASMNASARNFNRTLASTNDRFVAFAATAGILYGVSNAFGNLFKNAVKVEKALADIQVNVKTSTAEFKGLAAGLFDVASATGQSFYDVATAAAEFGRQGLKANKILEATQAAMILTRTTGMDAAGSVQSLTAAVNTFTKQGLTYNEVVNKMAAADTSFAVSSKDLAEGVKRVGSTALDANISFEELLATITSLQQKTSRGGAVIGNSLKTIFTRLQREGNATELENLGVQTKDSSGNFRNQLEVLRELAGTYDSLTASQQAAVSEMVGGVYQINIVKALFQDLSQEANLYSQALGVVKRAQNDAFVKNEFLSGTAASKINALKNSFVELSGVIGGLGVNEFTKNFASEIGGLVGMISDSLSEGENTASVGEKIGQSLVKGIVASVTGPGLAIFLRTFAQIGGKIAGNLAGDLKNSMSGQKPLEKSTRYQSMIDEVKLQGQSLQLESQLLQNVGKTNLELAKRNKIINSVVAAQSNMGMATAIPVGSRATSRTSRGKNFASGYNPLDMEAYQIANGVGGASRHAKPKKVNINTSPGKSEQVVVNTDEYIIRDYMGSGADAVFNKNMVRAAGGASNLSSFGNVSKVLAGGFKPKIKYGKLNPVLRLMRSDAGSNLSYYKADGLEGSSLNVDYMHSLRKGDAFEMFNRLVKISNKTKMPIKSDVLIRQGASLGGEKSNYEKILKAYPQLRYRSQKGLKTQLSASIGDRGVGPIDIRTFRNYVNRLDPQSVDYALQDKNVYIGDMITRGFAGGFVPTFAGGVTPNFADLPTRKLVDVLLDPNSLENQKELARNILSEKGVLEQNLIKRYKQGDGNAQAALEQMGVFNNPKMAKKLGLEHMSKSAIGKIAKGKGYLKVHKMQAQEIRASRVGPKLEARRQAFREKTYNQAASAMSALKENRAKAAHAQAISSRAQMSLDFLGFDPNKGKDYYDAASKIAGVKTSRAQATKARAISDRAKQVTEFYSSKNQTDEINKNLRVRRGLRERREREEAERKAVELERKQAKVENRASFYNRVEENPFDNFGLGRFAGKKTVAAKAKELGIDERDLRAGMEQTRSNRRQDRSNRWQNFSSKTIPFALGGAALGSMAGDAIGGAGGKFVGSAVSGATTLGSIGAAFGPIGATVGATIGVFSAMAENIKDSTLPIEKLTSQIQKLGVETEKQQNAIANFFQSGESLKGLIANPNADPTQLKGAVKQQALALADLPSDIRKTLIDENLSESKRQGVASEFMAEQARKTNAATAIGAMTSLFEKNNASATALTLRKAFSNGPDDSVLKVGDLSKSGTVESVEKIVDSLVSNLDLGKIEQLSKGGGGAGTNASLVLEALNKGDFSLLMRNLEDLGMVSEEVVQTFNSKVLNNIRGQELAVFSQATKNAGTRLKELSEMTAQATAMAEANRGASMDMNRFLDSFTNRKNILDGLGEIRQDKFSSRLSLISQDPGLTQGYKGIISTAQDLGAINSKRDTLNRNTALELTEFTKKFSDELGRGKIDKSLGSDFMAGIVDDLARGENIDGVLEKLVNGVGSIDKVSRETVVAINTVNSSYKLGLAQIKEQTDILLKQFEVTRAIEKKTKFDELINIARNTSPLDRAFEEFDFRELKGDFFNPTLDERKERDQAVSDARRTKNSDSLRDIINQDAETARELLAANDKKVARGEVGLSKGQLAAVNRAILKDQAVNSFGIQSDMIQSQSKRANLSSSYFTNRTLEDVEYNLASGNGSGTSIMQAINQLTQAANQISDPTGENQDKQGLLDLAQSLRDQLNSVIAGTDLTTPIEKSIAEILEMNGQVKDVFGYRGATGEEQVMLKNLQEKLEQGDITGAKKIASGGKGAVNDMFTEMLNKLDGKAIDSAINDRLSNPNSAIDTNKLLVDAINGLKPSNEALGVSMKSLNETVNTLTQVMLAESRVAAASAIGADISREIESIQVKRNELITQRQGLMPINVQENQQYSDDRGAFVKTNIRAIEASKSGRQDEAKTFLYNFMKGKTFGNEYDQKGFALLEEMRKETGIGVSEQDSRRASFFQSYRKSMINNETPKAEALDVEIKLLSDSIKKLGEDLKAANANSTEKRNEAENILKGGTPIPPAPGNLEVNVTGLDGASLASLRDDIGSLVKDKVKEMLGVFGENPKLFATLFQ